MLIITIERLTILNGLVHILPFLISNSLSRSSKAVHLYIIDTDRFAKAFLSCCVAILKYTWSILNFRLVELHDQRGNLWRLTISYYDLADIRELVKQDKYFHQLIDSQATEGNLLREYLEKASIAFVWNSGASLWRLLFITRLAAVTGKKHGNQVKSVLFAYKRPWAKTLSEYLVQYNVDIKYMGFWQVNIKELIINVVSTNMINRYLMFRRGLDCYDLQSTKENPKLVLEYYGLPEIYNKAFYSDFTFMQVSTFDSSDIVVSSQITAAPFDKNQVNIMRSEGIKVVALHANATSDKSVPVFLGRPLSVNINIPFKQNYLIEYQWAKRLLKNYYEKFNFYHQFFNSVNARIYLTWFKYDTSHLMIADAIRQRDGVMAFFQRAMEPHASAETATFADIFFAFSQSMANIEKESGSKIDYVVVTGYLGDHRFELLKQPAQQIREQLRGEGAKRIIAFFDENSGNDSRWHTGHEFMRDNYRFLFQRLLEDPELGLVLKPKIPKSLRLRLGEDAKLLEQVLATKRCFMYEGLGVQSVFPPAIAALSSDLTIHGHMCAATAGLEAALAGVPTVLLDREGWPDCPMRKLGVGRVIFESWEDLWPHIEAHWQHPNPCLGNWSEHINDFDPFRDGKASQRMGDFLADLMSAFKNGVGKKEALAQAARKYQEKWGKEYIIRL